jgi:hypothetical protein
MMKKRGVSLELVVGGRDGRDSLENDNGLYIFCGLSCVMGVIVLSMRIFL